MLTEFLRASPRPSIGDYIVGELYLLLAGVPGVARVNRVTISQKTL